MAFSPAFQPGKVFPMDLFSLQEAEAREGFEPGEIRDVIAGKRPMPKLDASAPAAPRRVDLIVDIQRLRSGKGPAYERRAKVYMLH